MSVSRAHLVCDWLPSTDNTRPIGDDVFYLGRNPTCKIKAIKCSRNHLEISFNDEKNKWICTLKGGKAASTMVNGKVLHDSVVLRNGDMINVASGYSCTFRLNNADCNQPTDVATKLAALRSDSVGNDEASTSSVSTTPNCTWTDYHDLHVYTPTGIEHRAKIAAFDMDGTLITTKSGRVFPKDTTDWRILYPEVPKAVKQLHNQEGYKIVMFTNQKGLHTGKIVLKDFKKKIESVCALFRPVPIQVYVSSGVGMNRKPAPGMWHYLERQGNGEVVVDRGASLYVGDAAGRDAVKKRKKDFSCGDRLFALNLGVRFETPEQFFLKQNESSLKVSLPEFNPGAAVSSNISSEVDPASTVVVKPATQVEIIIMVGSPASGKSHFVQKRFAAASHYRIVNQDTLKTWQKCVQAVENALAAKQSVVVDNTNADLQTRSRYVDLAAQHSVPIRVFLMNCSFAQSLHNNRYRTLTGTADAQHQSVNEMVLNTFRSRYVEPTLTEGYDSIVRINFVPQFLSQADEDLYRMYLVER